ncbi:Stp1/IreP family PP2C-type Ser/Thr phosphatase [Sorangium sp. So ce1014]|uniref:Stp1/IreP family PP2C-type Ser/Thr phosphatase n=1 Tax=Sorangium sp. So ce1014 TaxID=3133326 RepID=UPI003F61756C
MSDQTVRETPTEALEVEGLPSAASVGTDSSSNAGKALGDSPHGAASLESGKAGSLEAGKPVNWKPPTPPKMRSAVNAAREQKAGIAVKPMKAPSAPSPDKVGRKLPPPPRVRLTAGGLRDDDADGSATRSDDLADAATPDAPPAAVQAQAARAAPAIAASRNDGALDETPAVEAAVGDGSTGRPLAGEAAASGEPAEGAQRPDDMDSEAATPAEPHRPEVVLRLFGRTDVGQVREHNEDNFIVADLTKASRGLMEMDRYQVVGERGALLGVCDGMGGAAAGEVASQLAVDIIYQRMSAGGPPQDHDELAARLVQSIEAAGLRIFSEAKLDRTRRGMGTTSTIAALMDDHLFLGQVGDSRAYVLRGDRLVQVTRDQSLVNQLIEAGQLTEEEAETFEHNNIILQALGTADSVQVDLTFVELKRGDTLMLCSDGLSGMVRNEEIREVLRTVDDPIEACKVLTDRANQAGGHDNITVVVAKFDGDGLAEADLVDIEELRYQKYSLPDHLLAQNAVASEPARKVKELDEKKISQRPPSPKSWLTGADGDLGDDGDDYDPVIAALPPDEALEERKARAPVQGDEPIMIPTDGAPQWLVILMIVSAVACVTIAGYYLLR